MSVQAPDTFEKAIIGSIASVDPKEATKLALSITPELFHSPRNRFVYETLQGPAMAGTPLGSQTSIAAVKQSPGMIEHFGSTEGAVEALFADCFEISDPFSSWYQYAKQLKLQHARRTLAVTFDEAANDAAGASSIEEASSIALSRVIEAANLLKPVADTMEYSVNGIGMSYLDRYQGEDIALPFPQQHLNTIGGLRPGEIAFLAAYTGFRKSWIAIDWANFWMKQGKRVRYFTLEMPSYQVLERMISMEFKVAHENLIKRLIPIEEVQSYIGQLGDYPLEIIDGIVSPGEVMASAFATDENKPDVVMIDHLQLMRLKGRPEDKRVSLDDMLASMKGWAVDNEIALVILSQLRRPELRANARLPKPNMFMLKESGGIEQIADYVIFAHEEEQEQSHGFGAATYKEKIMTMWCEKQRNGEPAPEEVMHFMNYRMR